MNSFYCYSVVLLDPSLISFWQEEIDIFSRPHSTKIIIQTYITAQILSDFKGYTYSVFNLVYETNVASCRIWDALGFKRIGRIKGCGNLRSHPDELVDAIIYGRDLGPEGEDFVSEERFDKIRFYLKHGKYPNGADRAEKSRLRSAATHYKLLPAEKGGDGEERLMLKDKEVVSDPQRQYEIARQKHAEQHGGINKTTAAIAEMYHWVRIKETVSMAIKNCPECKDATKIPTVRPVGAAGLSPSPADGMDGSRPQRRGAAPAQHQHHMSQDPNALIERLVNFDDHDPSSFATHNHPSHTHPHELPQNNIYQPPAPVANMQDLQDQLGSQLQQELQNYSSSSHNLPLDPQIMNHEQQHYSHSQYDLQQPTHNDSQNQQDHELQHHQHHQHTAHDQLVVAAHDDVYHPHSHHQHSQSHDSHGLEGEDAHYDLDMTDLQHGHGDHTPGQNQHSEIIDLQDESIDRSGGDDTRLATTGHVTHDDPPMAFVREGRGVGQVGPGEGDGRDGKEREDDWAMIARIARGERGD